VDPREWVHQDQVGILLLTPSISREEHLDRGKAREVRGQVCILMTGEVGVQTGLERGKEEVSLLHSLKIERLART
jgi:hypothetical protein